jgi:hypothetical protein
MPRPPVAGQVIGARRGPAGDARTLDAHFAGDTVCRPSSPAQLLTVLLLACVACSDDSTMPQPPVRVALSIRTQLTTDAGELIRAVGFRGPGLAQDRLDRPVPGWGLSVWSRPCSLVGDSSRLSPPPWTLEVHAPVTVMRSAVVRRTLALAPTDWRTGPG